MSKMRKAVSVLLVLVTVFIGLFFSTEQAVAAVQIEKTLDAYGNEEIVITFEGVADFEKFYKKMRIVQTELDSRAKKFVGIRQIFVYKLLISELEGLFYSNILKPCIGNDMGLVKNMCETFAKIAVGVPEFIRGAEGELISLNYGTVKENLQKIIMYNFEEAEEMIKEGQLGIFHIKMTLPPSVI
ncbi:MAG: hypothetical protein Q4D57_04975 [Clostridia bacterium]|nr:hypothetical protein [Clostridia bacterium]